MKITIIATFLLSAVCMVYTQDDSGFRLPIKGASEKTLKGLFISCGDHSKAVACHEGLKKIQAPESTPDKLFKAANYGSNKFVLVNYIGTCAAGIQAIRSVPGCGMEVCPTGKCHA